MSAPALDQVIAEIVGAQPHEIAKEVVPLLKKLDKSASSKHPHVFEGDLSDGRSPLTVLDPAVHTVGYLFLLNARCNAAKLDVPALIPYIIEFTEKCQVEQLRLVPEQVIFFAKTLLTIVEEAHEPILAVLPLRNLVTRYIPRGHLSALHSYFLNLVMSTRAYTAVRELLLVDIVDIDNSLGVVKYTDNLTYHYLGGVIMALAGEFTRAMDMLEIVVSAPGQAVAAIQVDAYKKLLLVQLLAMGSTEALPKYTTPAVTSSCKAHCGPYLDYAQAYAAQDKAKLISLRDRHREQFEKDHNIGLLTLCERAFRRRTIQKLTDTYMTLSLSQIAKVIDLSTDEAGLKEVEDEILRMMADGEIYGSIDHAAAGSDRGEISVTFTDDPEPYTSHATVARVTRAIEKAAELERFNTARSWQISRSKDFVQKAYNSAGSGQASMGSFGVGDDIDLAGQDWDDGEED